MPPKDKSIVEEVRKARKKLWQEYNNDVDKAFDAMELKEAELRKQGRQYSDELRPSLPSDFYERLEILRTEKISSKAA